MGEQGTPKKKNLSTNEMIILANANRINFYLESTI